MPAEIFVAFALLTQLAQLPPPKKAASESTEVRYARAQLQLAEANLSRVEQSNKQMARSVPSSIVAEYEYDVQVAKSRLEQATAGRSGTDSKCGCSEPMPNGSRPKLRGDRRQQRTKVSRGPSAHSTSNVTAYAPMLPHCSSNAAKR